MKAKDFMIGDWVYWLHTEDGIAPYKEAIRIEPDDFSRDECIFDAHIEPIPLTEEILEKNGFTKHNDIWYADDVYRLDLGIFAIAIDDGCGVGFCTMHEGEITYFCNYVHELQHVLCVCCVEKDFKL